ncbi:MAG: polysaccharide biosynthesis protein PslG [Mycobacterium sp.]|nr:polysaccharide biosynthesis protein PslG [Mycobacterium sp.]
MINAADARGMGVLAVITTTPGWANDPSAPGIYGHPASPADFGTFAGLAAQRYAGQVGAYEIWNEPNAAPYYGPQPDPGGPTGAADRSRAGQAAQTTLLPRRARERMSQR